MPRNTSFDIPPELSEVIGEAVGEFATGLVKTVIGQIQGKKIPADALQKRMKSMLKQETLYRLSLEIRRARGEDV